MSTTDIIRVTTTAGQTMDVDLTRVETIDHDLQQVELHMDDGRKLIILKTPEFLQMLFHRTVSLEEAKKILAARTKH
jgi:hypothetical protein